MVTLSSGLKNRIDLGTSAGPAPSPSRNAAMPASSPVAWSRFHRAPGTPSPTESRAISRLVQSRWAAVSPRDPGEGRQVLNRSAVERVALERLLERLPRPHLRIGDVGEAAEVEQKIAQEEPGVGALGDHLHRVFGIRDLHGPGRLLGVPGAQSQ